MKQKTLDFFVDEQFIRAPHHKVVADSRGYLTARFSFGEAWRGLTKTAVFLGADGRTYHVLLTDDACEVPPQVLRPTQFFVSVFGGDRLTTDRVAVEVAASGFAAGITPPPTTPDIYSQLTAVFAEKQQAATAAADRAEEKAAAAADASSAAQDALTKANTAAVTAAVSADSAESHARASTFFAEQSTDSADDAKAAKEAAETAATAAAEDAAAAVNSATAAEQSATAAGQSAAAAAASAAAVSAAVRPWVRAAQGTLTADGSITKAHTKSFDAFDLQISTLDVPAESLKAGTIVLWANSNTAGGNKSVSVRLVTLTADLASRTLRVRGELENGVWEVRAYDKRKNWSGVTEMVNTLANDATELTDPLYQLSVSIYGGDMPAGTAYTLFVREAAEQ